MGALASSSAPSEYAPGLTFKRTQVALIPFVGFVCIYTIILIETTIETSLKFFFLYSFFLLASPTLKNTLRLYSVKNYTRKFTEIPPLHYHYLYMNKRRWQITDRVRSVKHARALRRNRSEVFWGNSVKRKKTVKNVRVIAVVQLCTNIDIYIYIYNKTYRAHNIISGRRYRRPRTYKRRGQTQTKKNNDLLHETLVCLVWHLSW